LDAVVATHPFHTLFFPSFYRAFPNARYALKPEMLKTPNPKPLKSTPNPQSPKIKPQNFNPGISERPVTFASRQEIETNPSTPRSKP
jgi:hypothetical protein